MKPSPFVRSVLLGVILALPVVPVHAQTITGVVLDVTTDRPLQNVQLIALDPDGASVDEALSNERGRFRLDLPGPGSYALSGTLIGYSTITSELLEFGEGDVTVEIRMNMEALTLDPIIVRGRARALGQVDRFYERMERRGRSGFGHFISREDIEGRAALVPTDLLRMAPGVRVVPARFGSGAGLRMSGGCIPAIYVDGMRINRPPVTGTSLDDMINTMDIEGIEVYRGASSQVEGYHDPRGCGLVLVWSRRGAADGGPFSWTKLFIGLTLVGGLLLLGS